jgi:pyruvate, water dikinase
MTEPNENLGKLLSSLHERAKELNCLYRIEEILNQAQLSTREMLERIVQTIPEGWQYPDICRARITYENLVFKSDDWIDTPWTMSADIIAIDEYVGRVTVAYREERPPAGDGPFLKEEHRLIDSIADRLGHFIMHQRMKVLVEEYQAASEEFSRTHRGEWQVVLDMLRQTDKSLFLSLSHKMLNHLCWAGVEEAERLLESTTPDQMSEQDERYGDTNRPYERRATGVTEAMSKEVFRIAATHLGDEEILGRVRMWIQEDKLNFLVNPLVSLNTPLPDVVDAIRRYHAIAPQDAELPVATSKNVRVSLIRRFFTEQLLFINIAKNYIDVADYYELLQNIIYTADSLGKLGGKSAGLFLAAQILRKNPGDSGLLDNLRIPKTWYVASDVTLGFIHYNNLSEVVEQKYKEINQVRLEYPHIVQTFKNSQFPPEIVKGLSVALDDFGDSPLIVRSSSLLEDRIGSAFSGKYKSLFLANQGTKQERLAALMDAIAEVYASVFGPDPIEYRAERGLLDFHEEMGIMIQEVVGTRVGDYYLPSFAGVAFSRNEFRWSARIRRGDGLIRLVPGLGTRAVDRTSDDYPVLIAPGQPNLRVNVSIDEVVRYAPQKLDVINLATNTFETVPVREFLQKHAEELPALAQIVSIFDGGRLRRPLKGQLDPERDDLVVTFEGLTANTPFIRQMQFILQTLESKLGHPVDIEFASDGKNFYLLQCRQQSSALGAVAAPIPKDIAEERIVFTANRYISNGLVPPITHVVYVDPVKYGELPDRHEMLAVGRAVSHLNKILPKRRFILMGPGRWGSRGDIKLGVSITYSDINNTAMLIEIARQQGNYVPDLSFGTHFFQDLVEAQIRYLPLYPDDQGIVFNERFLLTAPNMLGQLLPEFAHLEACVHVIDVSAATDGFVLNVLMNADLDEAVGLLGRPVPAPGIGELPAVAPAPQGDLFWRWRMSMAERVAASLDAARFGVRAFYVFGSTKSGSAGPGSDIDVLVHFHGTEEQRRDLLIWLEGWSLCLAEMNFQRTGYRTTGLLDVHIVTDDDIAKKTSYAVKIGAATDPARLLPIGGQGR